MRRPPDPRRALAHPLWWTALGVMLVDDHLLKGAGVLPGWLTGKLSDVAGLIVAPVLAAAVLRASTARPRALAFALPVLPFVAINLSPAAARAAEALVGAAGVRWTLWTDPTDLVALAVLPVAWWLCEGGAARSGRRALERVGLGLGALACIATSAPDPTIQADTWVVNHTGETVDLRLRWVEADVSCDAVAGQAARALSPDLFGEGLTFRLEPERAAPLDYANATASAGTSAGSGRGPRAACDAVMVEADGLPRTIVFWRGSTSQTLSAFLGEDEELPPRGLRIVPDEGERLRVESADLEVAPADERPAPSACFPPEATTLEWSIADLPELGLYRLDAAAPGPDGCWQLDLADDLDGTTYRAFVCVPSWAFPFRGADLVRITRSDDTTGRSLRLTREHEDGSFGDELWIARTDGPVYEGSLRGELVSGSCGADRVECGAFVAPASLALDGGDSIPAGGTMDLGTDEAGRSVSAAVGRAEEVLVSDAGCEPGEQALGRWADVLVLHEEGIE